MTRRKRLGDILQEKGLINESQLEDALTMQRQSGEKLGDALIKLGFVSPEDIAGSLSEHLSIPRIDFSRRYINEEYVRLVPEPFILGQEVLPIDLEENTLTVAMVDPLNIVTIDELRRITGYAIKPVIATAREIREAFQRSQDIVATARQVFDEYSVTSETQEL